MGQDAGCRYLSCFRSYGDKIIHGYGRDLKIWNTRDGALMRHIVAGGCIQNVAIDRWLCAATIRDPITDMVYLQVWDFAGDSGVDASGEVDDSRSQDPYNEECLAEEDIEFSDSDEEEDEEIEIIS
ncbi:hypothetical protein FRB99_006160 [Tulasnella sp. 403]|nr:hypothetical protein FRB99_006160 [Tulasnella sp. 403]